MSFYRSRSRAGDIILARFHEAERELFESCNDNEQLVRAAYVNGMFPQAVRVREALNDIHGGIIAGVITFRPEWTKPKK